MSRLGEKPDPCEIATEPISLSQKLSEVIELAVRVCNLADLLNVKIYGGDSEVPEPGLSGGSIEYGIEITKIVLGSALRTLSTINEKLA